MNVRPHLPRIRRVPALPRRMRWATRLLILLPLLVFLIASGTYLSKVWHLLNANLAPIVAGEIKRQIGHEVHLNRIAYSVPGVLTIDGISVSRGPTFAESGGQTMVTADRMTVHYSLRALIFDSGNALHALGDIVLYRPNLLVERYQEGGFNFSSLLKRKPNQLPRKPFDGRVIVHEATVRFRDYRAPRRPVQPFAYNIAYGVEATADFHSERFAYFQGAGRGGSAHRFANFGVSGDASRKVAGQYRVTLNASDADAAYWTNYFTALSFARVVAGRADIDMTFSHLFGSASKQNPIDYLGHGTVRNGVVVVTNKKIVRQPVQNIQGTAQFTGGIVTFHAQAMLAGQPVRAQGSVIDFAHPQLAVAATSVRIDPAQLAQAVPIITLPPGIHAAPGPASVQFTGTPAALVISADVTSPAVTYAGNRGTNVHARAVYANHILSAPQVTFRLNGSAPSVVNFTLDTRQTPAQIQIAGRVQGVNLATLALPPALAKERPRGLADVDFLAVRNKQPFRVTANIAATDVAVRRTTLRAVRGRIVWTPGQALTISRARIADTKGTATLSGSVPISGPQARWNLAVSAAGLKLHQLLKPYANADVSGIAAFQGVITGPQAAPTAVGSVHLLAGSYGRFTTDSAIGTVTASAARIALHDVVIRRFPAEARVSGTVTRLASGNPQLGLDVALSQGDIQDFVGLAQQVAPSKTTLHPTTKAARAVASALPDVTGMAEGTLQIRGSVRAPQVAGTITIKNGTVGAYQVAQATADLSYSRNTLHVGNVQVSAEGITAAAHGHYNTKTGQILADFSSGDLNLDQEPLRRLLEPYAEVTGTLAVTSGVVEGTVKAPAVRLSLAGQNVTIDGQSLAPFTIAGRYADGEISQVGAPWLFALLPGAAVGAAPIQYAIDQFRMHLPSASPPNTQRTLLLAAHIPAAAPERLAHVVQTLRETRFAQTPTGRSVLTQIARLPQPFGGAITVPALRLQGPLNALSVHAELLGSALTFGDNRLTQVAANVDYGNHTLTVHQFNARGERAYLEASGKADIDGQIAATLDASNIPLSLLNPFLSRAARPGEKRALSGEIGTLTVAASGLTRSPDLTASITLDKPTYTVAGLPGAPPSRYSLESVRSDAITVRSPALGAAKVLTVSNLAAFNAKGLVAQLSGTLPFTWGTRAAPAPRLVANQALHAGLVVEDLGALAVLSPLIDPARTGGTLTATLNAAGAPDLNHLTGSVTLANASVGLIGFDTALNKINGNIVLGGGYATIPGKITGNSSVKNGGSFALTGHVALAPGNAAQLRLALNNLMVDETGDSANGHAYNLLRAAYNTRVRGKINGGLAVSGPAAKPVLSNIAGAPLVVTDASGGIPSVTPQAGRIAQVNVEIVNPEPGAKITPEQIQSLLQQKPGGAFDPDIAEADRKTIQGLGYFPGGVTMSTATDPSGAVVVTYTASENPEAGFSPRFNDLKIALGGNGKTVSISGPLLSAQADGALTLSGRLSRPILQANLNVYRGQFIIPPSTRLQIIRPVGAIDLSYGPPDYQLHTTIDITAQATVTVSPAVLAANQSVVAGGIAPPSSMASTGAFDRPQRYVITAHFYGPLDKVNKELTSSPPGLSQQQMVAALFQTGAYSSLLAGGSGAEEAIRQQIAQAFTSVALPSLLNPLETGVAQAFGLSSFNVDYAPDLPLLLTLTKQVAPRLEVTYSRSLGPRTPGAVNSILQPPQYTLKLGYELANRLQISISTDDQRNNTLALEGVFGF